MNLTLYIRLYLQVSSGGGGGGSSDVKGTDNRQSLLLQLIIYVVVNNQKGEIKISFKNVLAQGQAVAEAWSSCASLSHNSTFH